MDDSSSELDKGLRIDGSFGYRYILIKQLSWVNYVSSRVGMRGWVKEDICVFINSVKTFRNLITGKFDEPYRKHEKEIFSRLETLSISKQEDRQNIYEQWSDLYADMIDLVVNRKKLIASTFGTDDWSKV